MTCSATGAFKAYGSWGRYYDWRGSAKTSPRLVRGRHLARVRPRTRYAGRLQPEPEQHAGRQPVDERPSPRPPRAELRHDQPGPEADVSGLDQPGTRVPAEPDDHGRRHYVHNDLDRAIDDVGSLDANGDEVYCRRTPVAAGSAPVTADVSGGARSRSRRRMRSGRIRRARTHLQSPLLGRLVRERQLTPSAVSTATIPDWRARTRSLTPTTGLAQAQRAAAKWQRFAPGRQWRPRVGYRRVAVHVARLDGCERRMRPRLRSLASRVQLRD